MKLVSGDISPIKVYFVFEGEQLCMLEGDKQKYAVEARAFKGEAKSVFTDLGPGSDELVIVGLGKESEFSVNTVREAAFLAAKTLNEYKVPEASIVTRKFDGYCSRRIEKAFAEGVLQFQYSFDKYLTKKTERFTKSVGFIPPVGREDTAGPGIEEAQFIQEGINITRDLVNTPSIDMYPEVLASSAKELLTDLGIEVKVYDKAQIVEMGMKAFLAVAEGSEKDPRFIVMSYLPEGPEAPAVALVGKGLTYDSGGYAIKPAEAMSWMKFDMAGSATVIGAIYALAKNSVKKNVIGVVAACENMISGRAYKNGDIIGSLKGSSIEVINTDAEGRLTLADAIYYASTELNTECIVDIATLTGSCIVGLGEYTVGAVTNDKALYDKIEHAADLAGEYLWQLPTPKEYNEFLKGDFGDLKNSTGRFGGAITAGLFLEHFTENKPWVHLDIAGPGFAQKPWSYYPQGATGIPVKTIYNFVADMARKGHSH